MTDRNRFIAEKLEPDYDPSAGWTGSTKDLQHSKVWRSDFVDFGKGNEQQRIAKDFDTDPAATVALIEALVGAGWDFLDVCFVESGGRHCATFGKGEAYGGSTDRDLMIAVRDAAYKALGGE